MQHRVFIARSRISIEPSLLDHPAYSTILCCCQRRRWGLQSPDHGDVPPRAARARLPLSEFQN